MSTSCPCLAMTTASDHCCHTKVNPNCDLTGDSVFWLRKRFFCFTWKIMIFRLTVFWINMANCILWILTKQQFLWCLLTDILTTFFPTGPGFSPAENNMLSTAKSQLNNQGHKFLKRSQDILLGLVIFLHLRLYNKLSTLQLKYHLTENNNYLESKLTMWAK